MKKQIIYRAFSILLLGILSIGSLMIASPVYATLGSRQAHCDGKFGNFLVSSGCEDGSEGPIVDSYCTYDWCGGEDDDYYCNPVPTPDKCAKGVEYCEATKQDSEYDAEGTPKYYQKDPHGKTISFTYKGTRINPCGGYQPNIGSWLESNKNNKEYQANCGCKQYFNLKAGKGATTDKKPEEGGTGGGGISGDTSEDTTPTAEEVAPAKPLRKLSTPPELLPSESFRLPEVVKGIRTADSQTIISAGLLRFEKLVRNTISILAILALVIGGFMYVTSRGNTGQTATAGRVILFSLVGLVVVLFADQIVNILYPSNVTDISAYTSGVGQSVQGIVEGLINFAQTIVGVLAIGALVYGGFVFITSGGDATKAGNAKTIMVYSVVGLLLVSMARFLVNNVLYVGGKGVNAVQGVTVITGLLNFALGFVGVTAVASIIYGGFLMILARGDQTQFQKGVDIVKYAAIGILLVMASWSVVSIVVNRAGG